MHLLGDWAPMDRKIIMNKFDNKIIFNLEGPIIKNKKNNNKIKKAGPHIKNLSLPKTNKGDIAILANNHFMDYGINGFVETRMFLEQKEIEFVGIKLDELNDYSYIKTYIDEYSVGIITLSEKQFASLEQLGYGSFSSNLSIYKQIKDYKNLSDFLILSFHGGFEMSSLPSTYHKSLLRSFIDAGVDLVYGHHSHVPQAWEIYKQKYIFYGLGNFCVDPKIWANNANALWSIKPNINIKNKKLKIIIEYLEIKDFDDFVEIRIINQNHKIKLIEEYIGEINAIVNDEELLEAIWQDKFLDDFKNIYIKWLNLNPFIFFNFYKKDNLRNLTLDTIKFICRNLNPKYIFSDKLLLSYHTYSNPTHALAIRTALGLINKTIKDKRNKKSRTAYHSLKTRNIK